ncbi:cell envelope biogenesis protein TolA [Sphingomonas sp. LY160]|uniref:cell envelope biogenesis protein TolA n=1 Tax=Sphingomonas sp. LY160 TaxID=3095342 RepID=UPI002ADEAFCF|nr:cell envelope biogenesis protein TolA [Sphingomonas sp. LY160]MEA1072744.1 cell envelope biogenesis protein TolA [Sphingomonas sp. LY160]
MEVELVEEVGLTAAAPTPIAEPPTASQAPEMGEAKPVAPAPAPVDPAPPPPREVPIPTPRPPEQAAPKPTPRPVPAKPAPRPTPAKPAPAKPAPAKAAPAKAAPAKPAPAKAAPRVSRLGDDFLKGISEAPSRPSRAEARPSAARFDAAAKADVASAIAAQIRPCAEQQRDLGPGANRIRVVLNLRLFPNGRLKGTPTIVRTSGVDDENGQYAKLVADQAIASYRQCAPLRLPADLYNTPSGGWANINMTYRVP